MKQNGRADMQISLTQGIVVVIKNLGKAK